MAAAPSRRAARDVTGAKYLWLRKDREGRAAARRRRAGAGLNGA
jgi:hypothetical protein